MADAEEVMHRCRRADRNIGAPARRGQGGERSAGEPQEAAGRIDEGWSAKLQKAYITASGMLDMAIAAVDKTSDAAKNFRRLRSRVRMPDQAEEARPLPEPVPGAK